MRKLLVGIAVAVALIGLGFGVARASIPSADGTIHACYSNANGTLRVIDGDTESCPTGYTPIQWDQDSLTGQQIITTTYTDETLPSGQIVNRPANCPSGKRVLGGGWTISSADVNVLEIPESGPGGFGTSWQIGFYNTDPNQSTFTVTVRAVCA